jgi:diguanylate cyclase (GGDEF)-like protein
MGPHRINEGVHTGPPAAGTGSDGQLVLPGLEIVAELGHGANGTVYRARRDGRDYAVKVLDGFALDGEATTAFRRQAALLAAIGHPGLPTVHEVGTVDGRAYLVMDLIDGRTLAALLAGGPLRADRAISVAVDIAEALAAMHDNGLVHRDLTPSNIILDAAGGRARLIDFDLLARHGNAGRNGRSTVGTLAYAAPEQSGTLNRPVDGRSDLYSLGVVLFECTTGRLPFASDDLGTLLRMHATTPPPDPRGIDRTVPSGLTAVILTLLAKDPDDRYITAGALLADLRKLAADPAGDLVPTTRPAPGTGPSGPLVGRRAEADALISRWRAAAAGHGGLAVIRGGAGMGKSRLVDELVAAARADGALVLRGKSSLDDSRPLTAIRDALAEHLAEVATLPRPDRERATARIHRAAATVPRGLLGQLHPLLDPTGGTVPAPDRPSSQPPSSQAPSSQAPSSQAPSSQAPSSQAPAVGDPAWHGDQDADDQGHLILAVAAFLAELAAAAGGLLLCLEDLHRQDAAGRRVLVQLSADLPRIPLLLVGTARDDARGDAALTRLIRSLADAPDLDLTLGRLDEPEVAALLAGRLPGISGNARLVQLLHVRSQGNPLVVLEYVRAIVDAGLLRPSWGRWLLDDTGLARLDLPQHAVGLVLARANGLGEGARTVLVTAAAAGNAFRADLVAHACGLPEVQVQAALADAVTRQLVDTRDGGEYAFVHDSLREALLADLDGAAAAAVHQRLAQALEQDPGHDEDPVRAYALARHYLHGRPESTPDAAVRAYLAAARAALAGHDPTDAVRFLRAVTVLDPATAAQGWFAELYGTALHLDGDHSAALDQLRVALATSTDPFARAVIRGRIATTQRAAWQLADALETVHEGLADLGVWLPTNPLLFALSSLLLFLAGVAVGVTGIGFGRARGATRERYRLAVALHQTAGYVLAAQVKPAIALYGLRALYFGNRIGPSMEYVYTIVGLGMTAQVAGRRRLADRMFAKAEAVAAGLHDLQPHTMVYERNMGRFLARVDDGQGLAAAVREHGRWFDLGQFSDAVASLHGEALAEGRTAEAAYWLELGRRRLAATGGHELTTLLTAEVIELAATGRPAQAAVRLCEVEQLVEARGGAGLAWLCMTAELDLQYEQGELGAPLDRAIAAFERSWITPRRALRILQVSFVEAAFGRLGQLRAAGDADRPARLTDARTAVHRLGQVAGKTPSTFAYHAIALADLDLLTGHPRRALRRLDRLLPPRPDAPLVAYRAAQVRARAYLALDRPAECRRQAGVAMAMADEHGWPHRARWITSEFGGVGRGTSVLEPRSQAGVSLPSQVDRQRLEAVEQVSKLVTSTLDPDELAAITLDATIRILSAERAILFLADPDAGPADGHPRRADLTVHIARDAHNRDIQPTAYSTTLVQRAATTGSTQVLTGTDEGAAIGAHSVVAHNLRSIMAAPLQLDGRLLGVVYLDSQIAKGIFTAQDAGILAALTNHIAIGLHTARAAHLEAQVHAARQQQQLAEALHTALATMTSTREPDDVLTVLLTAAARLLPGDRAWLVRPDGAATLASAPTGPATTAVLTTPPYPIEAGPALRAHLRTARLGAAGTGLPADPPAPDPPAPDPHAPGRPAPATLHQLLTGAASWLSVPLAAHVVELGLLVLVSDTPGRYQDADRTVAGTLVAQAMTAYDNASLFARLEQLATVDDLTGIANRRHFADQANQLLAAAARRADPVAALMIDIDHFKHTNDTYGHPTGDDVIRTVAGRMAGILRSRDVLGRLGGEEFAILLDNSDDPIAVAERVRAVIADTPADTRSGPIAVTVSVGLAEGPAMDTALTALLSAADTALYRAKHDGRNRVRTA